MVICVTAIFLTVGDASLVVKKVYKSRCRRAEDADHASNHVLKRDYASRAIRVRQIDQVAGEGQKLQADWEHNQPE